MTYLSKIKTLSDSDISRRRFVTGASKGALALGVSAVALKTSHASQLENSTQQLPHAKQQVLSGTEFDLTIDYLPANFTGKKTIATAVNGSVPAPTLHWREGDTITIRVKNNLSVPSSIHWHGIILPGNMDGVPGMSFDGIAPGETFTYRFTVNQTGTYWYHSHSGFQEQTGLFGGIIIEPKNPKSVPAHLRDVDKDYLLMLSDWSDMRPEIVYQKLKKMGHYFNTRERTVGDLFDDLRRKGFKQTAQARAMWNEMRMSDRDISDVTGWTYTFLANGRPPNAPWFGQVKAGEKVRLRLINAAAMTLFDVRIPNLKMTVVAADGQYVKPVTVDEFRLSVAETYDVIIEPKTDNAYCVFAQAIDRSGYTFAKLAAHENAPVAVPKMDEPPTLTHADMGMAHDAMPHDGMDMAGGMAGMSHGDMTHKKMASQAADQLGKAGMGSLAAIAHAATEYGAHIDMRADMPTSGLNDPGIGLRNHQVQHGRKVLTYADLKSLTPTIDKREPSREIQLHLTGNMNRYMWSIDGVPFADAKPLELAYGERVRIVLVNDGMMTHPIHLHGMWSELETGDPNYIPRKHTILVQPGKTISYLVTADAKGRWAYHCHLFYHMLGMMREVRVI